MHRVGWLLALGALALWPASSAAEVAISLPPAVENDGVTWIAGALRPDGRGVRMGPVAALGCPLDDSLRLQAARSAAASPTWRAPIAVGVVYLFQNSKKPGPTEREAWGNRGGEAQDEEAFAIADAVVALGRRLPERTVVYPTPYARLPQPLASTTREEIERVAELEPGEGPPRLATAIDSNFSDLRDDPAPLKVLVVLTDGRDDTRRPADFVALGKRLRDEGIIVVALRLPAPNDTLVARLNASELVRGAAGLTITASLEDLGGAAERVGEGLADLRYVRCEIPLAERLLGGAVVLSMASRDGSVTVQAEAQIRRRWANVFMVAVALVGAAAGLGVVGWRRRQWLSLVLTSRLRRARQRRGATAEGWVARGGRLAERFRVLGARVVAAVKGARTAARTVAGRAQAATVRGVPAAAGGREERVACTEEALEEREGVRPRGGAGRLAPVAVQAAVGTDGAVAGVAQLGDADTVLEPPREILPGVFVDEPQAVGPPEETSHVVCVAWLVDVASGETLEVRPGSGVAGDAIERVGRDYFVKRDAGREGAPLRDGDRVRLAFSEYAFLKVVA